MCFWRSDSKVCLIALDVLHDIDSSTGATNGRSRDPDLFYSMIQVSASTKFIFWTETDSKPKFPQKSHSHVAHVKVSPKTLCLQSCESDWCSSEKRLQILNCAQKIVHTFEKRVFVGSGGFLCVDMTAGERDTSYRRSIKKIF